MLIIWHWLLHLTPDPWHLISDTGTWYVILDTWSLVLDIWHRYLTCYHLILIPDTWYMTLNNWHAITYLTCFHIVLVHLTWYCDTWLDTITSETCITSYIHDYYFTGTWHDHYIVIRHLVHLNSCAPELLYSWTPEKGRLLILYPCWSP